jgi:hypothetical protein
MVTVLITGTALEAQSGFKLGVYEGIHFLERIPWGAKSGR